MQLFTHPWLLVWTEYFIGPPHLRLDVVLVVAGIMVLISIAELIPAALEHGLDAQVRECLLPSKHCTLIFLKDCRFLECCRNGYDGGKLSSHLNAPDSLLSDFRQVNVWWLHYYLGFHQHLHAAGGHAGHSHDHSSHSHSHTHSHGHGHGPSSHSHAGHKH
jgi:hypothetical protein